MKKVYLFGIMTSLLVLSAVGFAYAHNSNTGMNINGDGYYSEDEMNQMPDSMMQYIDDPKLVNAMNEMHEECIQSIREEEYAAVRGNMIGSYGMMGGGMM